MATPPPNLDTRDLPYGWIQQYNWEYRQWFYVNTREQPPRSSWEHPQGPMPQGFAAPLGPPPPDRGYSRSPFGGPPPPPSGYGGGYSNYQSYGQPPQGYYNTASGGYAAQPQVVYEQPRKQQKKGPGLGTAVLAGGAGLVGGALLMDAFEDHDQRERDIGFDQGYGDGFDNGQMDNGWGGDGGFF